MSLAFATMNVISCMTARKSPAIDAENLVTFCCSIAPQISLEFVQVRPLLSLCWNNALLTGLVFTGTASNSIAVAAYDTDEIRVWAIE